MIVVVGHVDMPREYLKARMEPLVDEDATVDNTMKLPHGMPVCVSDVPDSWSYGRVCSILAELDVAMEPHNDWMTLDGDFCVDEDEFLWVNDWVGDFRDSGGDTVTVYYLEV